MAKGVYPVLLRGFLIGSGGFVYIGTRAFVCGWSLRPGFVEAGKQPIAKESLATGCLPASTKPRRLSTMRNNTMYSSCTVMNISSKIG